MGAFFYVLEHPFAAAGFVVAILYIWSTFHSQKQDTQYEKPKRFIRAFGPVAIVLIVVLAVSEGLQENFTRVDFGMFYSSALLLRQDSGHLYDPQIQTQYLHAVTGLAGEPHYLPFAYPPIVAFLFLPLTALSFKSAYFVMLAVNLLLLGVSFWWFSTKFQYREDQRTALLVAAGAALPMYAVLVLGHLTFLAMLLLSLFVTDVLEKREWRPGVWTGLLAFKPIFFPVPLLILLWKRQWRAVGVFLLVTVAILLSSLALIGWSGLQSNAAMLRLMTSDYLLPRTQSLRGLVYAVGLGTWAWIVLAGVTMAALWLSFLKGANQRWVLAGAIIAVMLVPPYLQFYDLSVGLVAIAIVLATMNAVTERTRNYLFLVALVPGALVQAIPRDGPLIPIMPAVLIALFSYCLWKGFRPRSKGRASAYGI